MIKAIFWDNDGILVDTERLYFQATQQVLAEIGVAFTEAMYIDLFLNSRNILGADCLNQDLRRGLIFFRNSVLNRGLLSDRRFFSCGRQNR